MSNVVGTETGNNIIFPRGLAGLGGQPPVRHEQVVFADGASLGDRFEERRFGRGDDERERAADGDGNAFPGIQAEVETPPTELRDHFAQQLAAAERLHFTDPREAWRRLPRNGNEQEKVEVGRAGECQVGSQHRKRFLTQHGPRQLRGYRLGFGIEDAGGKPAQVKLRDRQVEPLDRVLSGVRQRQGGELADLPQNQQLFGIGYGVPLPLDAFGEKAQHLEIDQKLAAFNQLPRFLQSAKHEGGFPDVQHALEHHPGIVNSPGKLDEELENRFHHCSASAAQERSKALQPTALGEDRRRFPKPRQLDTPFPDPDGTAHGYFEFRCNLSQQHRHPVLRVLTCAA